MRKVIALVLMVAFASVYSVAPVFAGGGPAAEKKSGFKSFVVDGPKAGQEKNEKLACAMSAILPVTGQWYNGELLTWKSAAMAVIEGGSIFVLAFFLARDDAKAVAFAGMGGMIANRCWSSWDAYRSAKRINEGLAFSIDENRAMVSYNIPF